ncbi:hypothetical protein J3R83DRAFT_7999, partial [Lanmaoa asiatica]
MPFQVTLLTYPCPKCCHWFKNKSGLMQYLNAKHPASACPPVRTNEQQDVFDEEADSEMHDVHNTNRLPAIVTEAEFFSLGGKLYQNYHTLLNGHLCDAQGAFLPKGTPPSPLQEKAANDWLPFGSRVVFELADFLYTRSQMP